MLIQRQGTVDFSVVPRGLPKSIESYVGSFPFCDLSAHALRNVLSMHSPEQTETAVKKSRFGTTFWYDSDMLIFDFRHVVLAENSDKLIFPQLISS
jgi:hypothetical protein